MTPNNGHRTVAVVGAGMAGLASANRFLELAAEARLDLDLHVLEAGPRPGRAIRTLRQDGLIAEAGADSFLTENPAALDLVRRLGLEQELISVEQRDAPVYVVRRGRLVPIPRAFAMLAPSRLMPVFASPIFSLRGKLRMALEPLIPARRSDEDESISSFVTRRLGRETFERLVQPLAGGIYVGDPRRLSIRATLPRFCAMEQRYGSLFRGLSEARRHPRTNSGARWGLFASFRSGMAALVDALGVRIGSALRTGLEVMAVGPDSPQAGYESAAEREAALGPRWRLRLADGTSLAADAVVLAVPAYRAALLLAPYHRRLAELLAQIRYVSSAVVNTSFRTEDFQHPPTGFGVVVPERERRRVLAISFTSLKFAGRAPQGTILVRSFLGGALSPGILALDDDAMVAAVRADLQDFFGVRAKPYFVDVARWEDAMPQYEVGHLQRVAQIERELRTLPRLALAGAAYRGVGVPDVIRSGETAAQALFSRLVPKA